MEFSLSKNKKIKEKSHKSHWKLWISLIVSIFLIFIITLIVILCVFDNGQSTYKARYSSKEDLYNHLVVNSFDEIKENKGAKYKINQNDLNELFLYVDKESINPKVKNIYVDENSYTFYLDIDYPIKTRIKLICELEMTDSNFLFHVRSMTIGKFNAFGIAMNNYISDSMVESTFKAMDITLKSDLNNQLITYSKSNFINDFESHLKFNDNLFKNYFDEFSYVFNDDCSLTMNGELLENVKTIDNSIKINANLKKIKEDVTLLLNENIISKDNINLLNKYLLKGYKDLSQEEKSVIDILNLSKIGIDNKQVFEGVKAYEESNKIENKFLEEINKIDTSTFVAGNTYNILNINNFDLSNMLHSSTELFRLDSLSSCDSFVSFIVSNIFTEIKNNSLDIYYLIDVNGFETLIDFSFKKLSSSKSFVSTYSYENCLINNNQISSQFVDNLFNSLSKTFDSLVEKSIAKFELNKKMITLDFNNYVSKLNESVYFANFGKCEIDTSINGLTFYFTPSI